MTNRVPEMVADGVGRVSEGFLHPADGFSAGSRIGGYILQEQIGQGGMAVVFRALDERLERQVALKILAPALATDDAFRQRFIRESRAAAVVDDPHIIPVFEAGEADRVLFIAMRYVRGGDVRSLLFREGALPAARMAAIISPVASALDAAHAAGLVHRDIKPANMLLDTRPGRPDHVYLSDFGLSKEALASAGLTGTGMFLGTVDYASPEQIAGSQVDGRADQYALGCVAFEMLCGEPPFRRDMGMAVLYAHASQPPPEITARRPGLPASLNAVFGKVLAKSPQDRYGSCAEFTDALLEAFGIAPYDDEARAHPAPAHLATQVVPTSEASETIGAAATDVGTQAGTAPFRPASAPSGGTDPLRAPSPQGDYPGPSYPQDTYPQGPHLGGEYPFGWTGRATRKPRWPLAAAAAGGAAAAVAAAVAVVIAVFGHSSPGPSLSDQPPTVTATVTSPARTSPVSTPGPTWTTYTDPSGFSVDLPSGWAVDSADRTGLYPGVDFVGPWPGFHLFISWSEKTGTRALPAWQRQAASFARNALSYQLIRLQQVTYRDYNAAVWEFTDLDNGVTTQDIDWGFVVKPGVQGYAIELYGPESEWSAVYGSIWSKVLASFQPAPS
jgi:serine/threonine protein kinase